MITVAAKRFGPPTEVGAAKPEVLTKGDRHSSHPGGSTRDSTLSHQEVGERKTVMEIGHEGNEAQVRK